MCTWFALHIVLFKEAVVLNLLHLASSVYNASLWAQVLLCLAQPRVARAGDATERVASTDECIDTLLRL